MPSNSKLKIKVRNHAQERQWILRRGNGNLVKGARKVIQEEQQRLLKIRKIRGRR